MQKIDLVFMSSLNSPNGASVLVRKIQGANALFEQKGIHQRVIAPLEYCDGSGLKRGNMPKWELRLKNLIRSLSRKSVLLVIFRLQRAIFRPSRKIVERYDSMTDKASTVVFHEIYTCYEYLKKRRSEKQRVILILHGSGELFRFENYIETKIGKKILQRWSKYLEDCVLGGCDKIGFDADIPRRHFCELYPYDERKTFYVYNGIEERPMPSRSQYDKLRLICIATLSERKNQMGILNAIAMLPKEVQNKIELVLVGDGKVRLSLEHKAKQLESKIVFKGSANESEYYQYMLESNCFCLFSKSEGLPIAIIEGMRAGLPIIGSRVDGIPEEILEGETGFVVNLDEKELSEKFRFIVEHLDLLEEMGKKSYNYYVKKFTMQAMVDKYVQVYKQ